MRLPHVRFAVRRMTIAVAIAGFVLGPLAVLMRRSTQFGQISSAHVRAMADGATEAATLKRRGDPRARLAYARADHHQAMWLKYSHAARYPWLPVAPDPPEPKF